VPARETDDDDDDDVLIANRESGGWDRSSTRELIRVVAKRNGDTGGRFIHQVRMVKQIVKNLLDGIVPGLHVESWAFIEVTEALGHDEAVTRILEAGARLLGQSYTEPTRKDLISARLKPDVVDQAKPVLLDAAGQARQARTLTEAGDHNEAIRIWRGLIGDCFPDPDPQDDEEALRRSYLGQAITVAGAVSSTRTGGQVSRPTRPWSPD